MKKIKLDELCFFQSGLWKGKKPPFINVSVLRNTNFQADGYLNYSNVAEFDVEEKQFASRKLQFGDIILEKSGGGDNKAVGRVCVFEKQEGLFSLSNFTSYIRIKDKSICDYRYLHRFLYYFHIIGKTITMQRRSTGIRNLQLKEYRDIEIPLPLLAEQKRIVAKLDKAFAEIDSAIATTKHKQKEIEKFKHSLLKNELSPDSHQEKSETWSIVKLGDVCQILNGGTPNSSVDSYWNGNIFWLTPKDMGKLTSKYVDDTERKISELGLSNSSAKLTPQNSVILSCRAPIGHLAINCKDMAFNQGCKSLVPNRNLNFIYLYYFLLLSKEYLNKIGSGTTFKELSSKKLSEVSISLPPLAEQKRIVAKLDEIFKQSEIIIANTQKQLNEYQSLKKSLLASELQSEAA